MHCTACGAENQQSDRFCFSCGGALSGQGSSAAYSQSSPGVAPTPGFHVNPVNVDPQLAVRGTGTYASWRNVGYGGIAGGVFSGIGYFMPWLSLSTSLFGGLGSLAKISGDISGWSMTFWMFGGMMSIFDEIGKSSSKNSYGSSSSSSDIPTGLAIFVLLMIVDILLLILVPFMAGIIGHRGFKMAESTPSDDSTQRKRMQQMRVFAIIGLIPTIGYFLLIQGALGFSINGSMGKEIFGSSSSTSGGVSMGMNLLGIGFWISALGLSAVIISGLVLAPKEGQASAGVTGSTWNPAPAPGAGGTNPRIMNATMKPRQAAVSNQPPVTASTTVIRQQQGGEASKGAPATAPASSGTISCPGCGNTEERGLKYCTSCGTELPA
ncbi:MAG: zinc ribbon domain-containing protein [Thermoleophilia bacterium]